MANTGGKGVLVRQTGTVIVFEAFCTFTNSTTPSGTTNLNLFERQNDGTVKAYDWNSNTFVTPATNITTANFNKAMTQQTVTVNSTTYNTGIWTVALSTLTGFTTKATYYAVANNSAADVQWQPEKFQYGSTEGDTDVNAVSTGLAYLFSDVMQINNQGFLDSIFMSPRLMAIITGRLVVVSGSVACAGDFGPFGTISNHKINFSGIGVAYYIYFNGTYWFITNTLGGGLGSPYWRSNGSALEDSYQPFNGATGVAVVTSTGNPIDYLQTIPSLPLANSTGEALFIDDVTGGRVNQAQAGGTNTITLDASASSVDGWYNGDEIYLYGGTGGGPRGSGARATIIAYNGTTKVATVHRNWNTVPDSTTLFITFPKAKVDAWFWLGSLQSVGTDGLPKVSLYGIMGVLLSGLGATASWVAGAFANFFNIQTPTLTTADKNQTGDSYAIVNDGTNGNAALRTQINLITAKLPTNTIADETLVIAATNTILTQVNLVVAKLPTNNIADQTLITSSITTVNGTVNTINTNVNTLTTNLAATPAATAALILITPSHKLLTDINGYVTSTNGGGGGGGGGPTEPFLAL